MDIIKGLGLSSDTEYFQTQSYVFYLDVLQWSYGANKVKTWADIMTLAPVLVIVGIMLRPKGAKLGTKLFGSTDMMEL
jgi:hypothetical protein